MFLTTVALGMEGNGKGKDVRCTGCGAKEVLTYAACTWLYTDRSCLDEQTPFNAYVKLATVHLSEHAIY